MTSVVEKLKELASVDVFKDGRAADTFVGRPFYFDYSKMKVLMNDKWKLKVGGVPAGAFLLCSYDAQPGVDEMVLVRVVGPTPLPTDSDVVASMVEFYKEEKPAEGRSTPDSYTRYEFGFSGLECRVLGTFYRFDGKVRFGADVDNFFSAHNYTVYKPRGKVLEYIVNLRETGQVPGGPDQIRLGVVRYSASLRHANSESVPVYVSPLDFVGKRTALFGMTRTGKSNTVKKIVESVAELSTKKLKMADEELKPVGQIIFDINGEYANANQQDEGTAISQLYEDQTVRYSILEKEGFRVMKLNFHRDIEAGFGFIQNRLADEDGDYVKSFLSIDLTPPDASETGDVVRYERLVAAYRACLFQAGFRCGKDKLKFQGCKELNEVAGGLDPSKGVSPQEAIIWFSAAWDAHGDSSFNFFADYKRKKGHDWANEDLKAVMVMLSRRRSPGKPGTVSGFLKLRPIRDYHTDAHDTSFEADIVKLVQSGQIVIIDLSQGDPNIQRTYSDRICARIFSEAMRLFIANRPANFVQMYFEEAHNLFPKKEDKDLSNIYNRLAKEGEKLRIGLVYATQEVSSISGNVLKNTQNWFVSHLNNRDEIREVEKFYDFEDFSDSLLRAPDRGFIRMKTYSNPFIVPVQIDRFLAGRGA
jgi:hypothetical protein